MYAVFRLIFNYREEYNLYCKRNDYDLAANIIFIRCLSFACPITGNNARIRGCFTGSSCETAIFFCVHIQCGIYVSLCVIVLVNDSNRKIKRSERNDERLSVFFLSSGNRTSNVKRERNWPVTGADI